MQWTRDPGPPRSPGALRALLLAGLVALFAAAAGAQSPVRISGVHFDGVLAGSPEPDSAVRLINTDLRRPANVGGFVLTERFTPERDRRGLFLASDRGGMSIEGRSKGETAAPASGASRFDRPVRLPDGARIPPGGEIWIASTAKGFRQVFGVAPDYEAVDTDIQVPDAVAPRGFLLMPAEHGTVALTDATGEIVDFVAYEVTKEPYFTEGALAKLPWKGEPVRLKKTSFYGWKGQVLARDRDEKGRVLPDTDSAADWDSGFSRKVLGEEPTHRIELAGQSRFISRPLKGVRARVLATSAPDNNYEALIGAFRSAKKELRVRIYEMTNPKIVEELIKAKLRGVDVMIFLEGSPVGGIPDQERWLVDRAHRAGIAVHFLATPKGSKIKPRYRFDHSKYVLVDDRLAVIGSENYGRTGVPVFNSFGNRGWMVHVENPELVRQLREVWDHDYQPGIKADVLAIDASPTDAYGLPYRDPNFVPNEELHRGLYEQPEKPVFIDERMNLELVLSPDTSLNESSAILGMMRRAKKTLYVEQNSIRRRWGRKADSSAPGDEERDDVESTPNLALQAVVAAARRGVQVRVLLDSTWYNVQADEDRDNDDTVSWLNELGRKEGLDIAAKVINLETTRLEKVHTKGIIVDDAEVFVGSINWTENSFKGNREVGIVIGNKQVAGYYARLFRRDWSQSRIYQAEVLAKAEVYAARDRGSRVLRRLGRGDRVFVVAEHGKKKDYDGPRWLEVGLGLGVTGFIDPGAVGVPEATPGEALHVIGREAVIIGRVAATNVSERRIQLRLGDEKRPPFTAVIFKKNEPAFEARGTAPSSAFQGREVRIRGMVTTYKGPEVILFQPDQIEIVR
jgi:phosphatidylserine/phosphatidylglycerophosphate/cardiolipin synthase-like enzyme